MEFRIVADPKISKELDVKKKIWSIEDCKQYVEKNSRLPSIQRGAPLHLVLKNAKIQIEEKKEVRLITSSHYSLFQKNLGCIWKNLK